MAQNRAEGGRGKTSRVVTSSKSSSKKGFYLMIGLVSIAGVAALSYLSGRSNAGAPVVLDPSLPAVVSQGYVMGSPTASIELVEFGDFECPGCEKFAELTEPDLRAQYVNTGKIRFRFIDFPLVNIHRNTLNASIAAACADEQGQFWAMHDMLYNKQPDWNGEATNNPDKVIKSFAHTIAGLNASKFDGCLDTRKTLSKVQSHMKLAEERKVGQTPTFAIGMTQFTLDQGGIDEFKKRLDPLLAAADSPQASMKGSGKTTKQP